MSVTFLPINKLTADTNTSDCAILCMLKRETFQVYQDLIKSLPNKVKGNIVLISDRFSEIQVRQLATFFSKCNPSQLVCIYCEDGQSISAAVALVLHEQTGRHIDTKHPQCVATLANRDESFYKRLTRLLVQCKIKIKYAQEPEPIPIL